MRNLIYIILIVVLVGIASPVFALTVSPARVEMTGDPGTTLQGEIGLLNEQEGTRVFFTSFENFEPNGDSGAPHFIGAKDDLAIWIKTESKVVLESGKRKNVPFSITIPKNAEPGGHFAAIFFGSQEPGAHGSGQISVGGKIGVLVLLRVSGEVSEGGGLLEFVTKEKKRFFSTLPITFFYRFNNTGGNRVVPSGEIKIKNTARMTSATLLANKNEGSALPGSARKFEVVWTSPEVSSEDGFWSAVKTQWSEFHFGWYTAQLNIAYGVANQTANDSYNFFVIPWELFSFIFILLVIVGFLGRIGLKKYNRWIIARAQQQK
ncbi:MAG: hypothetical protein AAB351_03425 [Patescibacteria group bacterium]